MLHFKREVDSIDKTYSIGFLSFVKRCFLGRYVKIHHLAKVTNCEIGDFSYVANYANLNVCHIGKFCSIGSYVKAGLGRHPTKHWVSSHPAFYSLGNQAGIRFPSGHSFDESTQITIGHDVWLGANSIIIDGVNIGNGAIVGAASVVTSDVPAYAVVAGVPARIIRYRFAERDIQFLESLKWWDRDLEWLLKHSPYFNDIERLKSVCED